MEKNVLLVIRKENSLRELDTCIEITHNRYNWIRSLKKKTIERNKILILIEKRCQSSSK